MEDENECIHLDRSEMLPLLLMAYLGGEGLRMAAASAECSECLMLCASPGLKSYRCRYLDS